MLFRPALATLPRCAEALQRGRVSCGLDSPLAGALAPLLGAGHVAFGPLFTPTIEDARGLKASLPRRERVAAVASGE